MVQGIGPVDRDEIVKGYEVSKGNYVLLEDDEIEAAKVESRKTLDLVRFVDAGEIDVFYFEKPYYVVPADDLAEEAFVVLREALRASGKVGIGQISVRGRETLVSLCRAARGWCSRLCATRTRCRKAQEYFKSIPAAKPDKGLLDLATALIEQRSAPFDAGEFHDRCVDALKKLIAKKSKSKGKKILEDVEEPETARGSNVIDLMAALKKSVGEKGGSRGGRASTSSAPTEGGEEGAGQEGCGEEACCEESAGEEAGVRSADGRNARPLPPSRGRVGWGCSALAVPTRGCGALSPPPTPTPAGGGGSWRGRSPTVKGSLSMELNAPVLVHWVDLDLIARLGVAAVVGLLLGIDREFRGRAAGLRTHGLICFSAAAMTVSMISLYLQIGGERADVLRIFEATGAFIGIVGAGLIVFSKGG